MEERAEEEFARIDRMGSGSMLEGILAGIDRGYFQQEIAESAYREQERYEKGRLVKVGVNEFVEPDGGLVEVLEIPPGLEEEQARRVRALRESRDADRAGTALDRLAAAAATDDNLMPVLVDCARAMCTEGEIVGILRQVFGEYTETPRF
jgi:methylmalonyl-CoA mutase N-terminal domain/subunit